MQHFEYFLHKGWSFLGSYILPLFLLLVVFTLVFPAIRRQLRKGNRSIHSASVTGMFLTSVIGVLIGMGMYGLTWLLLRNQP